MKSCHNSTRAEVSYFVNPLFPLDNDEASFCDYRVDIVNPDVCQLRLDFEKFSLRGPHKVFGVCRKDRFMVTTSYPQGIGLSDLCGENTGQHVYVNVSPGSSVSLMVMTSGGAPYMWKIKITQIDCKKDSALVAPNGCLQYYTDISGTIQSFNYMGRLYQANLDYAICIRRSLNTCRVEYQQVPGSDFGINSFEGNELAPNMGRSGIVSCDLITHDYLFIPGGMKDITDNSDSDLEEDEEDKVAEDPVTLSTQEKFCGRSLSGLAVKEFADNLYQDEALNPPQNISPPSVVTSYASGPIIIRFHSDKATCKETDIGFSIMFQQLGTGCNKRA
uniref:CUB domain-containing protein n=2 Tax=Cacopsylla melanoneura TaxID=428564 RepID=A0A8D8Z1W6_9HEMI